MNMSTMDSFNPIPSLNHWFMLSNRHSKANDKAKLQEWFHGVFREASKTGEKHDHDDGHDAGLNLETLHEDEELSALNNFGVHF